LSVSAAHDVATKVWRDGPRPGGMRTLPEETAVALTYNGTTHAVMMATPLDLEDYAVGFSLAEGQIERPEQIDSIETLEFDEGIELRLRLDAEQSERFRDRRRRITGPTGCGLCGIESLAEAVAPTRRVNGTDAFAPATILAAQASAFQAQKLHAETAAVHGAAYWTAEEGLVAIREDVGRHNALDKLIGALARAGRRVEGGMLILTSRVSVEMVQKAAVMGVPLLVAASAPTALAVRMAEEAGITVVAIVRNAGFEVFTHPHRVAL
jgi:FdhD protein